MRALARPPMPQAMEMGADAVLVNTAIAASLQPEIMARAFARQYKRAEALIWQARHSKPASASLQPLTGLAAMGGWNVQKKRCRTPITARLGASQAKPL